MRWTCIPSKQPAEVQVVPTRNTAATSRTAEILCSRGTISPMLEAPARSSKNIPEMFRSDNHNASYRAGRLSAGDVESSGNMNPITDIAIMQRAAKIGVIDSPNAA